MSVLIKGMKMPEKKYAYCMLIKDIDGSVQLHVCTKNSEEMSEWELFNLVPVPSHGRLIDADVMRTKISGNEDVKKTLIKWIDVQETIIEAEVEE